MVVSTDSHEKYLVIDGYKRVAALQQLGRDTVEATVWAMSEAEALLLSRSLRFSPQESALCRVPEKQKNNRSFDPYGSWT